MYFSLVSLIFPVSSRFGRPTLYKNESAWITCRYNNFDPTTSKVVGKDDCLLNMFAKHQSFVHMFQHIVVVKVLCRNSSTRVLTCLNASFENVK